MSESDGKESALAEKTPDDLDAIDPSEDETSGESLEVVSPWLQFPVSAIGFAGFFWTIFTGSRASLVHPIFTSVSLAWLAFGFVVALLNRLDHIGFLGAKFSFRKRLERTQKAAAKSQSAVEALEYALGDVTDLFQNWMNSVNILREQLQKYAKTRENVSDIFARFCLERMEEARDVIGVEGERFRFSLWMYAEDAGGLKMALSDTIRDDATRAHVFRPGEGLCGQCFVEDRVYNYADAPASIGYQTIRENPEYHGLLLVPVKPQTDGAVLGVLSIDRTKKEAFDSDGQRVAEALAHLLAYAIVTAADFNPPGADDQAAFLAS